MTPTLLKFGGYSALIILLTFGSSWIWARDLSFSQKEYVGYLSILLSLIPVYFGIKYYRTYYGNGFLSFGTGLKLGLLITCVAALSFALLDLIYITWVNPEFFVDYTIYMEQQYRQNFSGAELESRLAELQASQDLFSNPAFTFVVMFLTVFLLGAVVSIISTFVLRKNRPVHD